MVHVSISPGGVELSPGGEIILPRQTWADYEHVLDCRGDNAAVKVRYDARLGEIRMMAPLPRHGKDSLTLSILVQALLKHTDQEWEGFDPITLKRLGEVGLEPDKCFYIANRAAILGKERIDLDTDPPPDLAIEIDATSSSKPEDYEPLGIPELWIYRGETLHIHQFDGQRYQEVEESPTFPGLPLRQWIPQFLQRGWLSGTSVALREFEELLRNAM